MTYQQLHYCPFHHVRMTVEEIDNIKYLVCPNPLCRWGKKEAGQYWWQLQDDTIQPHQVKDEQTS